MQTQTLRKKLTYFFWILLYILILLLIGSFLYLKTSQIGLTDHLIVEISGADGSAQIVSVEAVPDDSDAMKNIYLSQISYQVIPESSLSNGQTVTVEAKTDTNLSRSFQYYPIRRKRTFTIEGLSEETAEVLMELTDEESGGQ